MKDVFGSFEDINYILNIYHETDVSEFPILDKAALIAAQCEFANRIKPILLRNMSEEQRNKLEEYLCQK